MPSTAPNCKGPKPSSATKKRGRTEATISEEMSVNMLVKPSMTTLRDTRPFVGAGSTAVRGPSGARPGSRDTSCPYRLLAP